MTYPCTPAECEHDDGVSGVIWASGHSEFTCNLCGVEMWPTGPDPDDAWEPATPRFAPVVETFLNNVMPSIEG